MNNIIFVEHAVHKTVLRGYYVDMFLAKIAKCGEVRFKLLPLLARARKLGRTDKPITVYLPPNVDVDDSISEMASIYNISFR